MLHKLLENCTQVEKVLEVPPEYNGNVAFELPPSLNGATPMDGMEQKYDGHCWTKPLSTTMTFPGIVRRSKCVGELECPNMHCSGRKFNDLPNRASWIGKFKSSFKTYFLVCNPLLFCKL